jgi:hypothetical protein
MKKALFFLIAFVILLFTANAQNWTVSIPVNRTIVDYPDNIFTTYFCDSMNYPNGQEAEFRLSLPTVSGINYYVLIDYAINSAYTFKLRHGSNVQIMSLGDSMLLSPTGFLDTIHLSYAGYESYVSVKFKAVGTPTTAGQFYPCGSTNNGWFYQGIGCYYPITVDNGTYLTNCTVQDQSEIDEIDHSADVVLFPNPVKKTLNIHITKGNSLKNAYLILINSLGQKIKQISIRDETTAVSLDGIGSGICFYRVQTDNGILKNGKLVIE